ncbi:hypothetical protein [Fluviicola taffensis]|uniref:Uncharacterized protein n=1 Tax=Fluviicola taffensis (strain DSM 16823 / NCIMB 13979 / RW262) TaxID=755732 RepID=F2IFT6_FLUTR|nr:hypothetical protein [Fluviicola taffensis]AEA42544.1 hypothetical protein Fluta_0539 [Fluviicola taffensis DSM 16823]
MKKLFLLTIIAINITQVTAQVKIGDNPNVINANSMLELESTNKGFLPPRIPLNSLTSTAPMTATIAEGTIVYSDGGTLPDGYYYWNSTRWVLLSTARDNYVRVRSAADFPAPVAGVITLVAGVEYEINGTITLTNSINLNGCSIKGEDSANDKLVYTGAGSMFTGNKTGNLRFLTMTASSGSVFNIDALATAQNMIVQNCFFLGCNSIGTIAGVGGTVFFATVAYFVNTNGITFQNDNNVVMNNTLWDVSNSNIYERFIGTFNVIQLLGGDRLTTSTNSATALHISGITSLNSGSAKVIMFVGTGAYVTGTFTNAWEVETSGISTQKDDVAGGNMYLTTPVATTFALANTPVKVLGTTASASLYRATHPTSNRLTYTGSKTRSFFISSSLSITQPSSNRYFSFYIAKNGVIIPESRQDVKVVNSTDQVSLTISCRVTLAPNDYIEVWVENQSSTTNMTVQTMNLSME